MIHPVVVFSKYFLVRGSHVGFVQRWVRLLLGWVTVCGQINRLGMWPLT